MPVIEYQQTIKESDLITNQNIDQLKRWLNKKQMKIELLYKSSRDGYDL